jgi:hypothetical protein
MVNVSYLTEDPSLYALLLPTFEMIVAEARYPYQSLTEAHLQALWHEQKYFKNLLTADNEPITIISPGIWNSEAGPDFLKAHFLVGTREIQGDIEIHFSDENWNSHRHQKDKRYSNVVLHVSLWKSLKQKTIQTISGRSIIQTYLEDSLTIPLSRISQVIDLDLYPYKRFVGSGRCAQSLFKNLDRPEIQHFFKLSADWRLIQKRNFLKAQIENPNLQLEIGIAMALGYKHNAQSFFQLFMHLRKCEGSEEDLLVLALGMCGFFESHYQDMWSSSPFYRALSRRFESLPVKPPFIPLVLHQIRPLNHPIRRIAYLVKWLCQMTPGTLLPSMIHYWELSWLKASQTKGWVSLQEQLKEMLPDFQNSFWHSHFTFEDIPSKDHLPLMGSDLKRTILINAFLPLLHESVMSRKDSFEILAFYEFYTSFPASKTGKTKYLTHRFFGDTIKGEILSKAPYEQGAFQLHHDFCRHYEASCEGCPFVDKYHEIFKPKFPVAFLPEFKGNNKG